MYFLCSLLLLVLCSGCTISSYVELLLILTNFMTWGSKRTQLMMDSSKSMVIGYLMVKSPISIRAQYIRSCFLKDVYFLL